MKRIRIEELTPHQALAKWHRYRHVTDIDAKLYTNSEDTMGLGVIYSCKELADLGGPDEKKESVMAIKILRGVPGYGEVVLIDLLVKKQDAPVTEARHIGVAGSLGSNLGKAIMIADYLLFTTVDPPEMDIVLDEDVVEQFRGHAFCLEKGPFEEAQAAITEMMETSTPSPRNREERREAARRKKKIKC
jgi:hypothetical protein